MKVRACRLGRRRQWRADRVRRRRLLGLPVPERGGGRPRDGRRLIKIEDPRKVRTDAAQHQSETEIDLLPVDWTITNDRTIHDLEQAVLMLCTDA
jgi:hypothetical protein